MELPVANIVTAPVFLVLPRRSLSPGRSVIVYATFFFHPRLGRTEISSRCQSTRGSPSRGEIRNRPASDVAPEGRSFTTSLKRKITSRGVVPTLPLSGTIFTICGASVSTGPPGGIPGDAHAARRTAQNAARGARITNRKVTSLSLTAELSAKSILNASHAPLRLRAEARDR